MARKILDRRDFLAAALGGAAGAAALLGGLGRAAAQSAGEPITVTQLAPGLVQIAGAGGNVVAADTAEGLVMIDSGASELTADLLAAITEAFGERDVAALFNTHWHLDHTGGNEAAGAPRIIAHENTRLWMSTSYYVRWQDRNYTPRPEAARPNETFYASDPQPISLEVGGRTFEYAHLPEAHTDGDIYIFLPEENVIVAGDTVSVGAYPTPDYSTGGWIGGLVEATGALLDIADADTRIVPGTGPAVSRAHLEAQLEMLTTVRERMETRTRRGLSAEDMLREGITAEFDDEWGDPERFLTNVYHGIWWVGRSGASF